MQMRNKDQRLLRYFQRKANVRIEHVEEFLKRRIPSADLLAPDEMVAVFSLITANEPFPNVINALTRLSNENVENRFNDEFFYAMKHASRDLESLGLDKEASDLLKISEIAAQIHNEPRWANYFKQKIDERVSSRIRDLPFLHQRGW